MKKIILLSIFAFFAFNIFAQPYADFTGIRIFVNPGHGGHDGDDRHMLATDFWESEGNLSKGLQLRTLLENNNATVFMSRTTNTTADDLALSTISTMSNDANVDFFLSIHSNGFDGQRNQPLMLFRGYDNAPVYPESKVLATILFQKMIEKGNIWTVTDSWIQGDWDFYDWGTQGLGVLRRLTTPAVLSEGSFHDYIPEGWRLKNENYLLSEAYAFYYTFAEYFEIVPETKGMITGVLRNPLKSPDYHFAPGSVDGDIPINGALVTLTPGDIEYRIDNGDNGYFFFDNVEPGDYTLTFTEVPNFYTGTAEITVVANENTFTNMLLTQDETLVPAIVLVTPNNTESIILNPEFVFEFDLNMNTEAVENAITITPATDMVYTWSKKNTILSFKPQSTLTPNTNYNITLSTDATSQWSVPVAEAFSRDYVTINHTELLLKEHYPADGQTDLSTYLQIRLRFNAPIKQETVDANITLSSATKTDVTIKLKEFYTVDGDGYFYFEPETALELNTEYIVSLNTNLEDEYGEKITELQSFKFTTRKYEYDQGTVIESYDNISSFWDPNASGSTLGTIDQQTVFNLSTDRKMYGTGAGKLNYVFANASGGVCRVYNESKPVVGGTSESHIGVWVFGDNSNNLLEYWFYNPGNIIIKVGNINWAGWEFKYIPKTSISGSTIKFHSTIVRQASGADLSGTLYFDNTQYFVPTEHVGIEEVTNNFISTKLFPNPTSDRTFIQFNLKNTADICIDVYDLSGKKIETVYKASNITGEHLTQWMPDTKLDNGVYFIRIEALDNATDMKSVQNLKLIIAQ